jgi:hypothetical protein
MLTPKEVRAKGLAPQNRTTKQRDLLERRFDELFAQNRKGNYVWFVFEIPAVVTIFCRDEWWKWSFSGSDGTIWGSFRGETPLLGFMGLIRETAHTCKGAEVERMRQIIGLTVEDQGDDFVVVQSGADL